MKTLYNWDAWFAKTKFTLVNKKDYKCSQAIMTQQIRNAATARGLFAMVVPKTNRLMVSVFKEPVQVHKWLSGNGKRKARSKVRKNHSLLGN